MKNILKKLGVFGLIVAILLPFVELPIVNAEEDNCERHLQNYLFLDVTSKVDGGAIFSQYDLEEDAEEIDGDGNGRGYTTYASFPFVFTDTEYYEIKDIDTEINYLTNSRDLSQYWSLHTIINTQAEEYGKFYDRYDYDQLLNATYGKEFVMEDIGIYTTDTILVHGRWAQLDENGTERSEWGYINKNDGIDKSMQKINNLAQIMSNVTISGAKYSNDSFTDASSSDDLKTFIKKALNDEYDESPLWEDNNRNTNISFKINRTLRENDLNTLIFGYVENNVTYVFTEVASTDTGTKDTAIEKNAIDNSYSAFKAWAESSATDRDNKYIRKYTGNTNILDINTKEVGNLYWPVVLNVEYTACPLNKSTVTTTPVTTTPVTTTPVTTTPAKDEKPVGKWALDYDKNVSDNSVKNIPAKSAEVDLGNEITVDSTKPTREGYIFDGWCENKNGSGTCYQPGDKVASPKESTTKILFANWDQEGTEDNKKTGVVSYIVGFAAVGVVAGGIYLISKKKNLFKQI